MRHRLAAFAADGPGSYRVAARSAEAPAPPPHPSHSRAQFQENQPRQRPDDGVDRQAHPDRPERDDSVRMGVHSDDGERAWFENRRSPNPAAPEVTIRQRAASPLHAGQFTRAFERGERPAAPLDVQYVGWCGDRNAVTRPVQTKYAGLPAQPLLLSVLRKEHIVRRVRRPRPFRGEIRKEIRRHRPYAAPHRARHRDRVRARPPDRTRARDRRAGDGAEQEEQREACTKPLHAVAPASDLTGPPHSVQTAEVPTGYAHQGQSPRRRRSTRRAAPGALKSTHHAHANTAASIASPRQRTPTGTYHVCRRSARGTAPARPRRQRAEN